MNEEKGCIPDPAVLLKLARMRMPFGKYKERLLIDLPEPYVVWFARKGFPAGQLGDMLRMVYEIKVTVWNIFLSPCGIHRTTIRQNRLTMITSRE